MYRYIENMCYSLDKRNSKTSVWRVIYRTILDHYRRDAFKCSLQRYFQIHQPREITIARLLLCQSRRVYYTTANRKHRICTGLTAFI